MFLFIEKLEIIKVLLKALSLLVLVEILSIFFKIKKVFDMFSYSFVCKIGT